MARRFAPDVFVDAFVVSFVDVDVNFVAPVVERASFEDSFASTFKATSGMIPSGKEAVSAMGSSLHSGQISDPFP
jgi:hypothetical protein